MFASFKSSNPPQSQSSVNLSSKWMLRIMTSKPIVTMISSARLNQPSTIADVPTPLRTLPLPKSEAICEAATEAVCCQSTLTRMKTEAMKIKASAACVTGLEGNGLMSMSLPVRASRSSCHPGKVARRRNVTNARTMATMLHKYVSKGYSIVHMEGRYSHQVWKDDSVLECRSYPDQIEWILVHTDL